MGFQVQPCENQYIYKNIQSFISREVFLPRPYVQGLINFYSEVQGWGDLSNKKDLTVLFPHNFTFEIYELLNSLTVHSLFCLFWSLLLLNKNRN